MNTFTVRSRTSALCLLFLLGGAANSVLAQGIPANRTIPWQPGVPGGIPLRSTVCSVVTSFGAVGDGVHDDAPAIQNAINACAVGQVVSIPAGTFRLNSDLTIAKGISLRGTGPATTKLKSYAQWHAIQLGSFPGTPVATNVSGSPAKGATTITVASVTSPSLQVGDLISIDQLNDNVEVVNADGSGGTSPEECRSGGQVRCLGQIMRITAINGLTLTIDAPLYHNYSAALSPQVWEVTNVTQQAGVEDLSLERVSPTGQEGFHNFKIVACSRCWLRNIASVKTETFHVDLDRSFQCEIRDSFFNDAWAFTGGLAYGVALTGRTSAVLIENNIFYHARHAMIVKDGAAGNVFGYNYSVASYQGENWLATDMNSHGAATTMNLWEGNIGAKVYGDFTHGSSSYNTVYRNWSLRSSTPPEFPSGITSALRAVDLEVSNRYWNIVGNVLGQSGQTFDSYDPGGSRVAGGGRYVYTFGYFSDGQSSRTDATILTDTFRHGNYDYSTHSTIWDAGTSDHSLPASLYRSSKPAFFGGLPWPSIGPDLSPMSGTIPAKERYEGRSIPPSGAPSAPTGLRITP
jgi:hypothetical protein